MSKNGFALHGMDLFGNPFEPKKSGPLAERFEFPPFTVLDARGGEWQDRKRLWLALGIKSEVGRGDRLTFRNKEMDQCREAEAAKLESGGNKGHKESFLDIIGSRGGGTSIFDPTLCEMMYRWFCPPGGQVVDPFAGGSVRGIVASLLGFRYWGCDLRAEQVAANNQQALDVLGSACVVDGLTPIQKLEGGRWLKRDDLFDAGGARGGKARTAARLCRGATSVVTAGSRSSPQIEIVARQAAALGIPFSAHMPEGELPAHIKAIENLRGVTLHQHRAGYNNVIIARASEDAEQRGGRLIPFGMECPEAVEETAGQVMAFPEGVQRIVVPVGSGMTLAGVLTGLNAAGMDLPVLGVIVGADPARRLAEFTPRNYSGPMEMIKVTADYHTPALTTEFEGVEMDAYYEAKCLPFLQSGDLLWMVGRRGHRTEPNMPRWRMGDSMDTLAVDAPEADFIFSCPPYGDLERYSDDPLDLSTMEYHTFMAALKRILLRCYKKLKPNRFACFVVGDFRNKKTGTLRGFVADTITAAREVGFDLYNEAILLTPVGSMPIRATKQFNAGRKLGKIHQNILVFVKGDGKLATQAIRAGEEAE